uniref:Carbonic anhydrase n=1 Tax=Laticauda laticaudata TaxID=8630 RepID=A0A8C5RB80_LATLA
MGIKVWQAREPNGKGFPAAYCLKPKRTCSVFFLYLIAGGFPWPAPLSLDNHPLPSPVLLGLPKKMTLGGGGFPQPYQAAQLHLHWGSGHTRPGSEHTVDGHRYAGEIHVVHYSSRFKSFQEAASEPGGLAVLAAFLQVSRFLGEDTAVAGFDVAKLLPYDLGRYFRYNGSLTTPPCYQTVNWTVFNQTVRLSQEQISVLEETLQGDDEEPIQNNFRLLQGLYGRTVLSSFHSLEKVQSRGRSLPVGVGVGMPPPFINGHLSFLGRKLLSRSLPVGVGVGMPPPFINGHLSFLGRKLLSLYGKIPGGRAFLHRGRWDSPKKRNGRTDSACSI